MFLAIINDTYAVVKADSMRKKADFQMGDFFKTGVNNVRGSMGIQDRYYVYYFLRYRAIYLFEVIHNISILTATLSVV